jgi:hypothetical protein
MQVSLGQLCDFEKIENATFRRIINIINLNLIVLLLEVLKVRPPKEIYVYVHKTLWLGRSGCFVDSHICIFFLCVYERRQNHPKI